MRMFILFLLALPFTASADESISQLYKIHNTKGTLIISSLDSKVEYTHNEKRAKERFSPASTFKVLNTLIALEENIIDEKQTIQWDRKNRAYEFWNRDQTLKSAFKVSCVWCYQKFAREIGNEKYIKYLAQADYGNKKTGEYLSRFWLDGDLKISAKEQILFLKKLYLEELNFKSKNYKILKKIMLEKETQKYSLSAKTGWSGKIGWYVGYVEVKGKVWLFASNLEVNSKDDLKLRKSLVLKALKIKNII